jgi:hypothetical protein
METPEAFIVHVQTFIHTFICLFIRDHMPPFVLYVNIIKII